MPGASGHVLLAEDHPVNQRVATAMLENLGFSVDVVADGIEAVRAAARSRYRAILMDCQLPTLDGFEATSAIRAQEEPGRHTPIIAVTASASDADRRRCAAAGMDDYLPKPLNLSSLDAVLTRWVHPGAPLADVRVDLGAVREPAAESGIEPSRALLDPLVIDRLERLGAAAGEDLLGRLTTMFLTDAALSVIALRAALVDGNAAAVSASAHGLRGASANLGATELARRCATLSAEAATGDLAEGGASLDAIEAELERVREALVPRIPTP
jgi:CheY-like chemotaxis protein